MTKSRKIRIVSWRCQTRV